MLIFLLLLIFSGGGTTVTRVQQQGKRKIPENISKDNGLNEPKRSK